MTDPVKVMIVAPFWGQPHHVGRLRIGRFVRWLSADGVRIVLVRAGTADGVRETEWGEEITIRDPLGLYPDPQSPETVSGAGKEVPRFVWHAAYLLLNPDPTVLWARRASRHPLVLERGAGSAWVLSSSPPESPHLAASKLAWRLGAELIVDLRDGWLDEPLKPLLKRFAWQRWREGRLERRILRRAKSIFVTSEVWKELLSRRLPFAAAKTTVLTNGYPPEMIQRKPARRTRSDDRLTLLHAGRFTSSSGARTVDALLGPLLAGIRGTRRKGEILFVGRLVSEDLAQVDRWCPRFEAEGWSITTIPPVPHAEMIDRLYQTDGLLLLSASEAAVPSKFYEYLPSGRPVLSLTPEGSAVWRLSAGLPQLFSLDYTRAAGSESIVRDFLDACALEAPPFEVPPVFTDAHLAEIFLKTVRRET